MRARVGAMPQPKGIQHEQHSSRVRSARVLKSGMSLEDLKRQTAYRLAQEGGQPEPEPEGGENPNDESPDGAAGAVGAENTSTNMHYHPHHPQAHQYPREPTGFSASPHMTPQNNSYPPPQRGRYASYGFDAPPPPPPPANYGSESRNYTDSQLGVGGIACHGSMPQFGSPLPPPPSGYRPASQPLQPQNYSTPRMPRHATVLKDRGSAENSVGSDPSGGSDSLGYGYSVRGSSKNSPPSLKGGHWTGSHGKNLNKAGKSTAVKPQPKEMKSPDGRHTPVKEHNIEGQVLFATPTPNQRRAAPTAPYSETPRRNRAHQNMSPNYNRMRSPDHHGGHYFKGGGGSGGYYNKSHHLNKHQSKLPHGLTVQELKEMTRARLAAEAEIGGPEGSSDQSVHTAGSQGSSKGSDQFSLGLGSNLAHSNESVTRNLLQSNESIRRDYSNQGHSFQGHQQMQQMQQQQNQPHYSYPRHHSPVFGASPGPNPNHFNGGSHPIPRQLSPAFALSSSQTRSQGEAWETASAASSTLASDYHTQAESSYINGNNSAGAGMLFSSPISDSNTMTFNRSRCFSAGAGIPSSFDRYQAQAQAAYYDHVPLSGNRQRCATVSPPGMSRLHEDRPFLFSMDDKEKLAIPPLSEPRLRLHSTGGLNTHGTAMRAFGSSVSPPPNSVSSGSAFVPIGKSNDHFLPQSPPPLNMDRAKFNVGDRTISTESATSGHGDLPSSMAEAVLESITSTSGAPIGGKVIGASPFRSGDQELMVGESPFRVSTDSDNTSSAFPMDSLMPESSGSMSLFSSGESRNLLTHESSRERLLLGTHSWGGIDDDASHSNMCLSHDFSNLLNFSENNGPALRGRAATEPVWFGGNFAEADPPFVSRIDPEHNEERKGPHRVSSLVDTNGFANYNLHSQQGGKSSEGC